MKKMLRRLYRTLVPEPVPLCDADTIAVLVARLQRDSCAIDIGCNRGSILREIVRLAPDGNHFAFEPIPRLYRLLCKRFPTVDCRRIALSDVKGTVTFNHFTQMDGFSGMVRRDVGANLGRVEEIAVETERLDAIVPEGTTVTLIKIDVEGAEYRVLRGAESLLRRCRPTVIFECGKGGLDIYGHKPEQVYDLLTDCGLSVSRLAEWSQSREPISRQAFVEAFWGGVEYMFVAGP